MNIVGLTVLSVSAPQNVVHLFASAISMSFTWIPRLPWCILERRRVSLSTKYAFVAWCYTSHCSQEVNYAGPHLFGNMLVRSVANLLLYAVFKVITSE